MSILILSKCTSLCSESVISIYGVNSSTSRWRIANFNSALSASKMAKIKGLAYSLTQRVQDEDRFDTRERTLIKGLYKSIPTERAEELLNDGVKDEYAVATAIKEYYDSTIKDSISSGSYTASDRNLDVQDAVGNQTHYDFTDYIDNELEINTGNLDDTVDLGGIGNNIILNLDSGDNIVNVDTSNLNDFVIKSGSGVDTVNLSGSAVDYGYTDNSDGTLTLTNLDSGATVTIEDDLNNIGFEDGSTLEFDGSTVVLETSSGSESFTITENDTVYDISMNGGNDTLDIQGMNNDISVSLDNKIDNFVSIAGQDNIVSVNLNSGQDTVFVKADSNNQITVNGGDYTDVVILEGDASEWTQTLNTFVHNTLGTSVNVSKIEQVVFGDVVESAAGLESTYDLTASSNTGGIIDLNDMDDTVNLGGDNNYIEIMMNSGDNTVNVDDVNYNKFFVRGGTGNDTLNFTGNVEDYTFQNNDNGSLTVVNTDSGAKTVLDSNIETITFADGSDMTFDGTKMVINSSSNADTLNITGENNEVTLYTNSGDDNITVDGTNNKVTIFAGNGDDNIFVAAGDSNEVIVDGAYGTDTLTLQGTAADWVQSGTAVGKTYYDNLITGTRVTLVTDVDNVVFDNAVVINDTLGVSNNYDLTGYNNSTIVVNSAEGNDTIALDGNNNTTTVNLTTGNNTVTIDDTGNSTYVVNGGTGIDLVSLTGNTADYTSVTNIDDTVTYTNNVTGSTITLNPDDIEGLFTQDGTIFGPISIEGTPGDDNIDVSGYDDTNISVNAYEGNDIVTAGGSYNNVIIDVGDGNDVINIDDTGINSVFNVAGGLGVDTVNMSGNLADYEFLNFVDSTFTLFNSVSGSKTILDSAVENIILNDGSQVDFDGTTITITDASDVSNIANLDSSANATFLVNAGNQDDTINLGGLNNTATINFDSGTNIVNVDDSYANTFVINGGSGVDTINMSGDFSDYAITDNGDNTLTLTNNSSGATTTLDTAVESVLLSDGTQFGFDGVTLTITDVSTDSTYMNLNSLTDMTFVVNVGSYNDTINLGGLNNNTTVNLDEGTNIVNVDSTNFNTFVLNGGTGLDTVNMSGDFTDYTMTDNGDSTLTFVDKVSGASTTIDSAVDRIVMGGTQLDYDGTSISITLTDDLGNANNFDITAYNGTEVVVNARDMNDTINIAGEDNDITANLGSGDNTVNVDDTLANTVVINGGTGIDTVNMLGDFSDYTVTDNGDNTLTLANNLSGATTTINTAVENVVMGDGTQLGFDGTTVTLTDAVGNTSNLDLTGFDGMTYVVNAGDMNDTLDLGGVGNDITANLDSGNDVVNIDDTSAGSFVVNGGAGVDTVNVAGDFLDYTITDNGDNTLTLTNSLSGADITVDNTVENIVMGDGTQLGFDGTTLTLTDFNGNANNLDLTSYIGTTFVVNAGDMNDTLSLGGDGNDITANLDSGDNTVNVNDALANTVVINGGTGDDTVNMSGDFLDYTITDNGDNTLTLANNLSGATTTIDAAVENVTMTDGTQIGYDGTTITLILTDDVGSASTFDLTGYDGASVVVNAGDMNDTIGLGGNANNITANLDSGDNTVNVDDALANTFVINGGSGTDTVNMAGDFSDYTVTDNGDNTLTFANNVSGATTTIDISVENIVMADGTQYSSDGSTITLTDAIGNASNFDLTANIGTTYVVNTGDMNDTLSLGGDTNSITANLGSGNNTVNIDDSNDNTFVINGGTGTDTVNMSGGIADYNVVDNGDNTLTLTNKTSGATTTVDASVEGIVMADGTVIDYDGLNVSVTDALGNASSLDLNTSLGSTYIINSSDMNDTINLGGSSTDITVNLDSGDNAVNIDDTQMNSTVINGGTGTDTVTLAGNIADYTSVDNGDGTTTYTNTVSGATITLNPSDVENLVAQDGLIFGSLTVNGTINADNIDLTAYNNSTVIVNANSGNDTVSLGGSNNDVTVNLDSGNNAVNIDDSQMSSFVINGGTGTDVVTLSGNIADYTSVDNGDGTTTYTNTISGATTTLDLSSVETVNAADGLLAGSLTINGTINADNIDLTAYNGASLIVNANSGNDTVGLGGSNNDVTVNLDSGDNTVNVDDTSDNTFVINGGTGVDTVNMSGNLSDYSLLDNGDNTLTLTNNISGATTTIDASVENVGLADGSSFAFDGSTITIVDPPSSASTFDLVNAVNVTFDINVGNKNDTVNLGGSNNSAVVYLVGGDNIVNVDDANANTFVIYGGNAEDTVNMAGDLSDYSLVDNGDSTFTLTNTVSGATTTIDDAVENVIMADAGVINFDGSTITVTDALGNATNLDLSGVSNTTYVVNAADMNDTVALGGDGNDFTVNLDSGDNTVNIDDTGLSQSVINGGTGTDEVVLTGDYADYSIVDNGGSRTITNTLVGSQITVDSAVDFITFTDGTYTYDLLIP